MNYELAKELKDAGFPLKWVMNDGSVGRYQTREFFTADSDRAYMVPSLEELIEACGDGFESLTRSTDGDGVYWWASSLEPKLREFNAKTPTEAVARLWLALNKKQ